MSYNIVEYHNIKLYSNMEALYTQPEELPQAISCHIRNCLEVTRVVSATAGDVSDVVSVMLVCVQSSFCTPTNINVAGYCLWQFFGLSTQCFHIAVKFDIMILYNII